MNPEDAPPTDLSVLDTEIEQRMNLLQSIDAQWVDRLETFQSGDLSKSDFLDWAVRARDKKGYVLSELVELRHRRHLLTVGQDPLRVSLARLRHDHHLKLVELKTANVRINELEFALAETLRENGNLQHRLLETPHPEILAEGELPRSHLEDRIREQALHITQLIRQMQVVREGSEAEARIKLLKENIWNEMLLGEAAILHPEQRPGYLKRTAFSLPDSFRDDFIEKKKKAFGWTHLPRHSSELPSRDPDGRAPSGR